jgi:mannose-6-phosphate isomerase-like protein (cupin superfamily)
MRPVEDLERAGVIRDNLPQKGEGRGPNNDRLRIMLVRKGMTNKNSDLKTDHRHARARRVVTGVDANGKSTFVSDELVPMRFVGDAFCVNMVWQVESLPVSVNSENSMKEVTNVPPPNGYNFFVTTFPPDASWDYSSGYAKSLEAFKVEAGTETQEDPSMHATETVDIILVIKGEVWAVMETGETLLKQGDSLIQRGTKHTWHNRTHEDCVVGAFMASATR